MRKISKKGQRIGWVVGTIITIGLIPTTVHAIFQDDGTIPDIGTILDNIYRDDIEDKLTSIQKEIDGIFGKTDDITSVVIRETTKPSELPEVFQEINLGKYEGIVREVLGLFGLLNPAEETEVIASGNDSPYSNPETPEEVYEREKNLQIVRSQIAQKVSQGIFSPQGQQLLEEQSVEVATLQEAALVGQEEAIIAQGKNIEEKIKNINTLENISVLEEEAISAKASQDVLKAIAQQNKHLGNLNLASSNQLSNLGEIAINQSIQLTTISGLSKSLNDKMQMLEILSASQNNQLAQIETNLIEQHQYQQTQDSIERDVVNNIAQMIYIPGLFSDSIDN